MSRRSLSARARVDWMMPLIGGRVSRQDLRVESRDVLSAMSQAGVMIVIPCWDSWEMSS